MIKGYCDYIEGNSMYVTILLGLMAIVILDVEMLLIHHVTFVICS